MPFKWARNYRIAGTVQVVAKVSWFWIEESGILENMRDRPRALEPLSKLRCDLIGVLVPASTMHCPRLQRPDYSSVYVHAQ